MRIADSSSFTTLNRYQTKTGVAQNAEVEPVAAVRNATEKAEIVQQQREVQALQDRDRDVRNHEQAHLSAAGGIALSGAHFQYTTGPDGQRYATGGDVSIDTSAVPDDPAATLRKAETIRRAAMAPAQPSAQDYRVASNAAAMANRAGIELLRAQQDLNRSGSQVDVSV